MKNIGFMGGCTILELGKPGEMKEFFTWMQDQINTKEDQQILDRLYRKYIKYDELDRLYEIAEHIKSAQSLTTGDKYFKYIDGIEECIISAKSFYEHWKEYQPLITGVTDIPECMDYKDIPLEVFDALSDNDLPFWLR